MEKIPALIKDIRRTMGMTQLEFAILIDSTRGNVAKYEVGITTPPGDVMLRILEHQKGGKKKVRKQKTTNNKGETKC